MANCWLVKSELADYPIARFQRDKITQWTGVRNYQARNYLMQMKAGEAVLFYHSNAAVPGVAGVAVVQRTAYPDSTQFDKKSPYFDLKSSVAKPRWFAPDLRFDTIFQRCVSLEELRGVRQLTGMRLLQRGSRLSIQPVTTKQFDLIVARAA